MRAQHGKLKTGTMGPSPPLPLPPFAAGAFVLYGEEERELGEEGGERRGGGRDGWMNKGGGRKGKGGIDG